MSAVTSAREDVFNNISQRYWWDGARNAEEEDIFLPRAQQPKAEAKRAGKRSTMISHDNHGSYFKARPATDQMRDLAFDATIRAAAPFQQRRRSERNTKAIAIHRNDIMRKVRMRRASRLIVFLVDLSWSMAVTQRMAATKGAIMSLLTRAYQARDRVCLITFQKNDAVIVLPPTSSVMLAERSMKDVPIGGKTPLSAGLWQAYSLLSRERMLHPDTTTLLIVLTDGIANVSKWGGDPMEESAQIAHKISADKFRSIVINTEAITFGDGQAVVLADQLKAPCYQIAGLKSAELYRTVENELNR